MRAVQGHQLRVERRLHLLLGGERVPEREYPLLVGVRVEVEVELQPALVGVALQQAFHRKNLRLVRL